MVCNCHQSKILLLFLQTQSIKKSLMKNGSTYDQLCFFGCTFSLIKVLLQLTELSFE
jgi:hypothetical protein